MLVVSGVVAIIKRNAIDSSHILSSTKHFSTHSVLHPSQACFPSKLDSRTSTVLGWDGMPSMHAVRKTVSDAEKCRTAQISSRHPLMNTRERSSTYRRSLFSKVELQERAMLKVVRKAQCGGQGSRMVQIC